jgi:hypothetical protein
MKNVVLSKGFFPEGFLRATANFILHIQLPNGCIPWEKKAKADPWNHIEAAMGLTVAGEYAAAQHAYSWLSKAQLPDGSWWANYAEDAPLDKNHRETNFVAYVATGVWHYFLASEDYSFLREYFPVVKKAINFVLQYQAPSGEIYWAVAEDGSAKKDALVTASSSIYKSLHCAILMARQLNQPCEVWQQAYLRLGHCLREQPECFDRTWETKQRFSMDWFYPVLTGVVLGYTAKERLNARWDTFVENNRGCRCVSDEPWVTVAESCELTLALLAADEHAKALSVFSWLHQFMDEDGGYWTGYNFQTQVIWPQEKTTWTAGVVLLAADALTQHSRAANLFTLHSELLPVVQPLRAEKSALIVMR